MTYEEIIDRAVREKAETGCTLGDITFPLINMIATMVANVVVENRLEPVEEIENVFQTLDELYEKYLKAYNEQGVA